ncbi:hypothetical protein D9M72_607930 [compost metagenome]
MINQDVVDLYDRVPNGTPIVVTDLSGGGMAAQAQDNLQPQNNLLSGEGGIPGAAPLY